MPLRVQSSGHMCGKGFGPCESGRWADDRGQRGWVPRPRNPMDTYGHLMGTDPDRAAVESEQGSQVLLARPGQVLDDGGGARSVGPVDVCDASCLACASLPDRT